MLLQVTLCALAASPDMLPACCCCCCRARSDDAGATPLMLAVEANSPALIKWLLEREADPQAAMASGWRAIHLAVRLGHESCVLMLLQQVWCGGRRAWPPPAAGSPLLAALLCCASRARSPCRTAALTQASHSVPSLPSTVQGAAGVDDEDECGLTPLATAAGRGAEALAELLLDQGADLSRAAPPRCITAAHVAAYHNQGEMLQMLLDRGISVNLQDANGHTPLHVAALLNRAHLIGPLLAAGADTSLQDRSGKSAHQLALDKGSTDVLRQLDILQH